MSCISPGARFWAHAGITRCCLHARPVLSATAGAGDGAVLGMRLAWKGGPAAVTVAKGMGARGWEPRWQCLLRRHTWVGEQTGFFLHLCSKGIYTYSDSQRCQKSSQLALSHLKASEDAALPLVPPRSRRCSDSYFGAAASRALLGSSALAAHTPG